jgi:hypothetical protein
MPTVQTTPLTATPQMPMTAPTTMNVPQANAAAAAPLFQLPQAQNPLIQPQQQQVLRMADGGYVQPQDPAPYTSTIQNDPYMSDTVSTLLGWKTNPWHPTASSQQQQPARMQQPTQQQQPQQPQQTSQQPSQPPTVPQPQQAPRAAPAAPGASAPNIGTLAGEQAYVTGAPVSGIPSSGGLSSPQAQSALSGVGQGLTQAAKAIAESTPPWQWITPQSMGQQVAPPPPPVTFGQVRT